MVSLWNTERWGWNHLLPAQAHVRSEDENGGHIEEAPPYNKHLLCSLCLFGTCLP